MSDRDVERTYFCVIVLVLILASIQIACLSYRCGFAEGNIRAVEATNEH